MNTVDWAPIIGCGEAKNNNIIFKTRSTTLDEKKKWNSNSIDSTCSFMGPSGHADVRPMVE